MKLEKHTSHKKSSRRLKSLGWLRDARHHRIILIGWPVLATDRRRR